MKYVYLILCNFADSLGLAALIGRFNYRESIGHAR